MEAASVEPRVNRTALVAQAVAAAVALGLLSGLAVAGHGALWRQRAVAAQRTAAVSLADGLAARCSGREDADVATQLAEAQATRRPQVQSALAVREGGVDEFGISRGSAVLHARLSAGDSEATLAHARRVAAEALRAAQTKQPMAVETLLQPHADGRLLVLAPLRDSGGSVTGAIGAWMAAAPSPPPRLWVPVVAALLAACVVVLLGKADLLLPNAQRPTTADDGGNRGRGEWSRWPGSLALCSVILLSWLMLPALPAPPAAGVAVLAAQRLVPHTALPALPTGAAPVLLGGLLLAALWAGRRLPSLGYALLRMRRDPAPYGYIAPASVATAILVFVPLAVGVGLSFADSDGQFIGLGHYLEVLESISDSASPTHFFRTLGHTVAWTVVNVALHVILGLGLALLLNRPQLRGRAAYRMLLILPWAVPSYITALTWKWLFNTQAGPINQLLALAGVGRVDWLGTSFWTNFGANLATNVWLGFPFMMVISLGALQSIPAELYEAAELDGATPWQQFRHVTLPLLRPALFPAIILGTIWTFNAFNVIWLVSGGGPDHRTDILITEAYHAFAVLRRTGLAAAYSVLIFLILLGYTWLTQRRTRATEAVTSPT
jgi:ABC-type sugar transport system permease subunit